MYGFFFDNSRCTGCRTCEMACVDFNNLSVGRRYRRVIDYEGGSCELAADGTAKTTAFCYHVSLACNHCANPKCVHVCPTGAMHKNELGLVCVDAHKCIGCGYCTIACPYHAPSIDPEAHQSSKCDGCTSRVEQGKRPICVEACPLRALDFGEVDGLLARHADTTSDVVPLPSSEYTNPNLYMRLSPAGELTRMGDGFIANSQEIENNHKKS